MTLFDIIKKHPRQVIIGLIVGPVAIPVFNIYAAFFHGLSELIR